MQIWHDVKAFGFSPRAAAPPVAAALAGPGDRDDHDQAAGTGRGGGGQAIRRRPRAKMQRQVTGQKSDIHEP